MPRIVLDEDARTTSKVVDVMSDPDTTVTLLYEMAVRETLQVAVILQNRLEVSMVLMVSAWTEKSRVFESP